MSIANAYNFIFDRSGLVWFVIGLVLTGSLLFFAGLLIGVNWGLPQGGGEMAVATGTPEVRPRSERLFVDRPERQQPAAQPAVEVATPPAAAEPELISPAPEPEPEPEASPPPEIEGAQVAPVPAAAAPPRERRGWVVQAGAFTVEEHVVSRLADLARIGFEGFRAEMEGSRGQRLIAVRIGPYSTRAEAEDVAAEVGRRGGIVSFVRQR